MKPAVLCVFVIFAIIASSVNAACPGSCPPHKNPVCGFDGMCLYNFNNGCEMIRYNCQRGGHFRNADSYQCQSAKNGGNLYQYCRHINGF
ncbi:enhancer of split M1 protein-like [Episyrphus balteatus]|uniref:enhancer of split M1 protein-like n=1 Tax=Episyrphus balteatus TaxID=286459 RepID=UPI002485DE9F|nr:enhancer of split M1 protein-like [Episyrphus balteatus]XP_055845545.1 enhancer of split M1 protein-like [Episyrphus balteatus]